MATYKNKREDTISLGQIGLYTDSPDYAITHPYHKDYPRLQVMQATGSSDAHQCYRGFP